MSHCFSKPTLPTLVYQPHIFSTVKVKYGEKVFQDLKLYVTDTIGPPLFGRSWLNIIQLDWSQLFKTSIKQMDIDVSRKPKS